MCAFLTAAAILPCAQGGGAYSWYFKRAENHQQPALDSGMTFIRDYNVCWMDENAGEDKVIYLTFDAGYENGNVALILDALKKHNAHGAFFILDHLVEANTELCMRMINEGHLVCNHTQKHRDMSLISDKATFAAELAGMEDIFRQYTGHEMAKLYRPPKGCFSETNLKQATELGYRTVFWSFAYADWDNDKQPDPDSALQKILKYTHNGMIILLHPTSATNAAIMDRLLTEWEKMGYRFGSLNDITTGGGSIRQNDEA